MNEDEYFESDGVSLRYRVSPATRTTDLDLVLVHGFGASLETWFDLAPMLRALGRIWRLDLKGFGLSSKPRDGRYSPEDQADLLREFLAHVRGQGRRLVLTGHSYGGGVVLLTCLGRLEPTLRNAIRGIVLIDPAIVPQPLPFFVARVRNPVTRTLANLLTRPAWRARYVLERIVVDRAVVTDDRVERYARFLGVPGASDALAQVARQIDPDVAKRALLRLGDIRVPVLIIWGANDPVLPVGNAQILASGLRSSVVEVIPRAGHIPHEERPGDTYSAVERFVDSLK